MPPHPPAWLTSTCPFGTIGATLELDARSRKLPQYFIPVGEVVKQEPKSEGINTPRKKKPRELAAITECCTGCAGSPACVPYCPVEDCMYWVPDDDHPPFGRIEVDPYLCIGCKKCTSKGPDGSSLVIRPDSRFWMASAVSAACWRTRSGMPVEP